MILVWNMRRWRRWRRRVANRMVDRVMNRSNWAASLTKSEIRILATLLSFILSAELSQASSLLYVRPGVCMFVGRYFLTLKLPWARPFVLHPIWLLTLILMLLLLAIFSDKFPSFDSELLAELQGRMISFESFHHVHCVLRKFVLPLFFHLRESLAFVLALDPKLGPPLSFFLLLDLFMFLPLKLSQLG